MKRGYLILSGILFLSVAAYATYYCIAVQPVRALAEGEDAALEWMFREFDAGPAEAEQIRKLHAEHDAICVGLCEDLAARNQQLLDRMRAATEVTPEIDQALRKAAELREECRRATLKHIYEVSELLPADQAERYRKMMTARLVGHGFHHHTAVGPHPLPPPDGKSDDDHHHHQR